MRGADAIDIRVLAVHRHADVIESDRRLIDANVGSSAQRDAEAVAGRQIEIGEPGDVVYRVVDGDAVRG